MTTLLQTYTPSVDVSVSNDQLVGTDAEALVVGDIGTAGWFAALNNDAENFVVISLNNDGSAPFAKLRPGQFCVLPVGTKTLYAKADTAPVTLSYVIGSA